MNKGKREHLQGRILARIHADELASTVASRWVTSERPTNQDLTWINDPTAALADNI